MAFLMNIFRHSAFLCLSPVSLVLRGVVFLCMLSLPGVSFALGQAQVVVFTPEKGSFPLAKAGQVAPILVDRQDYPGVRIAAGSFVEDLHQVSGVKGLLLKELGSSQSTLVIAGTIGKNQWIDQLIQEHRIDVAAIRGKWESTLTQVVDHPFPGVESALIIAGSDKRGTIYGIYDLSEQIGVSPWYWWADVPPTRHAELYVKPGPWFEGEPAVKYRGIFLNDEAPALSGWTKEQFGGFNHKFYAHVFELLLRLKANYLWPAMWGSAFNEDDPDNPRLADEYGIVMGTSHHEPMLRAQQEWKRHGSGPWDYAKNSAELKKFWEEGIERNKNYESAITLGMRGDGDEPMSETDNIGLLEKIVADQRAILAAHSTPTLNGDLKVWALYKEVQGYYEKGMRVPDDVTLLWSDDNWGNIRRLPTPEERKRSGGAGIYYHFDYVGDPRNYKWLLTYNITKIWEQMHLAKEYGADRVWIVNVGDLKPMEFPIEFFLSYARHPERWEKENLRQYTELWAAREFGAEYAKEAADLIDLYTKYNSRRKPEQLEPETFSLTSFHEAERVMLEWQQLVARAEKLNAQLSVERRDAFFELILYPLKASAVVNEMYIEAGKNHLYAAQGRASANDAAARAHNFFAEDAQLRDQYNLAIRDSKWNHMMDQTHIGYTYWQEPRIDVMPAVSEVRPLHRPYMQVAIEGSTQTNESWAARMELPEFDLFNQQDRWIDLFNSGDQPFEFTATPDQPWIQLSESSGSVLKDKRLLVRIDWKLVPQGTQAGSIRIAQKNGNQTRVTLHAFRSEQSPSESFDGFVEASRYVSMEAEHFSARHGVNGVNWEKIPGFGETLSAMSLFPVNVPSFTLHGDAPTLEYRMWLFESGSFHVEATIAPTLNFVPGRGLRFAVSFDNQPPVVVDALAQNTAGDWSKAVSDGVRRVATDLKTDRPGEHALKIRMIDPGVVLERLLVSHDAVPASYLGPPESFHTAVKAR